MSSLGVPGRHMVGIPTYQTKAYSLLDIYSHGCRRSLGRRRMTSPLPREEAEAAASKENAAQYPMPPPAPPVSTVVRLFVGDLSPTTTQQSLCEYFSCALATHSL